MAISKAEGYKRRVFTIEYDLNGMLEAFGREFVIFLMDEIQAGRVNCKQDVDRWAAHVDLYGFEQFPNYRQDYGTEGEAKREAKAQEDALSAANAKKAARAARKLKKAYAKNDSELAA